MGLVGPGSPYQPTRSPGDSLQHIPTAESNSEFGRCWDSNDSTTQRSPLAESSWRKRSRRASSKSASSGIGKQRCRNSGVQRSPLDHITGTQNANTSQPRLLPEFAPQPCVPLSFRNGGHFESSNGVGTGGGRAEEAVASFHVEPSPTDSEPGSAVY